MRYLLILLLSLPAHAIELDLSIPYEEVDWSKVEPIEDKPVYIFNFGDYHEPPTRNQMIAFWTLNALDVYITNKAMRKCPRVCKEANPLLPENPELEELLLQKAVVAGFMHGRMSKDYVTVMNVMLTGVVISNWNIVDKY